MTTEDVCREESAACVIQRCYRRWKRDCARELTCPLPDGTATLENPQHDIPSGADSIRWERKSIMSPDSSRKEATENDLLREGHKERVDRIMQMLKESEVQNAKAMTLVQGAAIFGGENSVLKPTPSKQAEGVLHKFRKKLEELNDAVKEKDSQTEKLKQKMEHQSQLHKMEIQNAVQIERARYEQQ